MQLRFGALFTSWFSERFGRKPCLIASGIIYLVGSLLQSVSGLGSSQDTGLKVLFFSRFIGGIGVGMVSALVPSYVSECTPRAIRGRCTGFCQLALSVGVMLSCKPFQSSMYRSFIVMQSGLTTVCRKTSRSARCNGGSHSSCKWFLAQSLSFS